MTTHGHKFPLSWFSIVLLFHALIVSGCGGGDKKPDDVVSQPADTYFSLAVTDNGHNHTGARLLFLDFQSAVDRSVVQNNVVISPQVSDGAITLDGNTNDWDLSNLTKINGLPQNNYPLSEFYDAVPTTITMGSAWDTQFVYFVVQWEDAGHNASTKKDKWIYGDQGHGEQGWNPKYHVPSTDGAPNTASVNRAHRLSGVEDEDRILMMFPIVDTEGNFSSGRLGCAAYCHANLKLDNPKQFYTGEGVSVMHTNTQQDIADVWHWKSTRSAPAGFADDGNIGYSSTTEDGHRGDSGKAAYQENSLTGNHPRFRHRVLERRGDDILLQQDAEDFTDTANTETVTGDTLPGYIIQTPDGSRADVMTQQRYDAETRRWTVEFKRARVTQHADDRQFAGGGRDAAPPTSPAIALADANQGATLFGEKCIACHGPGGAGVPATTEWSFPRNQRASGSLILKALGTVPPMSAIQLSEQQAEDLGAFLQTQATNAALYPLSVTLNGVGTTSAEVVTSSPAGISCPGTCTFSFGADTTVRLTAQYISGFSFNGWAGSGCTGTNPCDVLMSQTRAVTANYTAVTTQRRLNVSVTGNGVVTSSNVTGINCGTDCTEPYNEGAQITLTATPAAGYRFVGWSGACTNTSTMCTLTMNADSTVSALFETIVTPTCDNKGVTFDTGKTNGYGLQYAMNANQSSATTDIAFIPGASTLAFLTIEQTGKVNYFNGACNRVNQLDISKDPNNTTQLGITVIYGGEQGLLNVEFHPDYATNHYVFFYHTTAGNLVNSVSRMTVSFSADGKLQLSDPQRIIDFHKSATSTASNHNGGGLVFASDKTLLASVGDGGSDASNAQKDINLLGKVIRVIPNLSAGSGGYSIPATGNMFAASLRLCGNVTTTTDTGCPEILAKGLRNPFRLVRDGDVFYIGDVGNDNEEINSFTFTNANVNFGWPTHDGMVVMSMLNNYRNPIVYYDRRIAPTTNFRAEDPMSSLTKNTSASIMIGSVYRGEKYPPAMRGALPFDDFYMGFVRAVGVDDKGDITDTDGVPGFHLLHSVFVSGMVQGPDDFLYLTSMSGNIGVYRLVYQP